MNKKSIFTSLVLGLLMVSMAACSALPVSGLTLSVNSSTGSSSAVQSKLGAGILKLQDSELAVTAEQSAELLPLWKAVKNLTGDVNTTSAEIQALYDQMEENMSSEQLAAISVMTLSESELNELVNSASGNVQISESKTSTSTGSSTGGGGGMPGGDMGGGPGGGGDMGGGDMGGMLTGASTSSSSSQSSDTKSSATNTTAKNYNLLLADSIISLLQSNIEA
ncbi:MAG: hypothetical protein LWX83_02980 [Anaerolineae bacterium]|nr:hypothetical protein [Anaerolineae bacterium]